MFGLKHTMHRQQQAGIAHDDLRTEYRAAPTARDQYDFRHFKFGGFKGSAVFYGWLVAVGLSGLLAGVVSVVPGVGSSLDVTSAEAELRADTIEISLAIAVVSILTVGYFGGGYVAGRLARFDGARQGFGVWAWGLLITVVMVAFGDLFGSKYNIFARVNLPSIPTPEETLSTRGLILIVAALVGTLLAALVGGKKGQRFHTKIDRTTI